MDDIKVTFDETEDIKTTLDVGSIQYGQLEIGTTITGEAGTKASVTNTGSSAHAILNFTIPKGDKGDKGDAGSIKFIAVTELPTSNIDESAIYMKPSSNQEQNNTYEEFIYADGKWESLGAAQVKVDLEPYATKEGLKQLQDNVEEVFNGEESMGSIVVEDITYKNLLSLNSFQSQTLNGLTATKNNDGSITINGTATANTFFPLNSGLDFEENEAYTLSGCPTGGNYANKYSLYIDINNTEKEEKAKDEGNGTTFTPTATTGKAYIVVRKEQTLNNIIFKPQLELGINSTPFVMGKDFKNKEIYSNSEIKIGTWTNGKPLYRKVIENSVTSRTNFNSTSYDISTLNIDKLTKLDYSIYKGNTLTDYNNFYGTSTDFQRIFFRSNKLELRADTGATISESTPAKVTIIIEYTKTTD